MYNYYTDSNGNDAIDIQTLIETDPSGGGFEMMELILMILFILALLAIIYEFHKMKITRLREDHKFLKHILEANHCQEHDDQHKAAEMNTSTLN